MASKITNNANGPRSIHTSMGVVTLQPGESLGDDYKVADADLKAMAAVGLLEPTDASSKQGGTASIADVQREIASMATPASLSENALVAEDDDEVLALKDSGSAADLRKLAADEGVALEGDDNKLDMSRKIITARRGA